MSHSFFQTKRFVAMLACLTGMAAMGIDSVLPTFPAIITEFAIPEAEHNRIQQVVFVFMLGFASLQLVFGVLADVFGRKTILLTGLGIYVIASVAVLFANDFEHLLIARFLQGAGLSAPRVLTMTIVRDRVSGAAMSRIMSVVMMVFLLIPIIAPIIGQIVMMLGSWRSVFVLLLLSGIIIGAWVNIELPETLAPENRLPLNFAKIRRAGKEFLSSKETLGYLFMISLLFGILMTYIGLAEQILQRDVYHLGTMFPLFFALVVTGMLAASFINSRYVVRLGMKKMMFIAIHLLIAIDIIFFLSTIVGNGIMPLWLFISLLALHFLGFGLAMPNLNASALVPYQHIAGTASALVGTITTILGVAFAQLVSHFFDGTLYCIAYGYIIGSTFVYITFYRLNKS